MNIEQGFINILFCGSVMSRGFVRGFRMGISYGFCVWVSFWDSVLGFRLGVPFGCSVCGFCWWVLFGGSVGGVLFGGSIRGFNSGVPFGSSAWGYQDMSKVWICKEVTSLRMNLLSVYHFQSSSYDG